MFWPLYFNLPNERGALHLDIVVISLRYAHFRVHDEDHKLETYLPMATTVHGC